MRVGVIGLGTGTLAAYGRAGRLLPLLRHQSAGAAPGQDGIHLSEDLQSPTGCRPGRCPPVARTRAAENFDVLAVDAFSSDAIPVHLLTREAFVLYFRHLKPDGVLAVHVSNKHLDLTPVVKLAAAALGKDARLVDTEDEANDVFGSTWVLVTSSPDFFDKPLLKSAAVSVPQPGHVRMWTDDYSNLFQILK